MDCDICLTAKDVVEKQLFHFPMEINEAVFAVKENGVLLLYCAKHMAEFHNLHETVLLPADTYVPKDDEPDIDE